MSSQKQATKITPIRQRTSNNDAADKIGKPKKKTTIKVRFSWTFLSFKMYFQSHDSK